MREFEVCREAVRAGCDVVSKYFRDGVEMRCKESYNLVSDADVEAEKEIGRIVQKYFPDHHILGEEIFHGHDTSAEHLWIVDPIDGTVNYTYGIPHACVSIALQQRLAKRNKNRAQTPVLSFDTTAKFGPASDSLLRNPAWPTHPNLSRKLSRIFASTSPNTAANTSSRCVTRR